MVKLILNSQKKDIIEAITHIGLEPIDFEWKKELSKFSRDIVISCLRYKNTDYFFKFDFYSDHHYCIYSPGLDKSIQTDYSIHWAQEWKCFVEWLSSLKREIDTPDPWAEIERYIPGEKINLEDEQTNKPFSYSQVQGIELSLKELGKEIRNNFKLSKEQGELVQNKLNYLTDRAKSIGKIDWKNIFVSTIIMIAFELAMKPEETRLLWGLVKNCFKGVLLLGGK